MNANDIKIGTKFEIEILNDTKRNDESSPYYISQLVDVIDNNTISIAAPIFEGRLKYLHTNSYVVIYYINERQDLLCFKALVNGHKTTGAIETFELSPEGELTKIQRRKSYRLNITLDCKYRVDSDQLLSDEKLEFPKIDESAMKKAYVKNISANGLSLLLEETVIQGSILDIVIDLDGSDTIRVFAQVVRSIGSHSKSKEIGLNFVKIDNRDVGVLTKFIFEKQRIILKNTMQAKL